MHYLKIILFGSVISGWAGCFAMRSNVSSEASLRLKRQGFVSRAKSEIRPVSFKRILVVLKLQRSSEQYAKQFHRAFPANYQVCTLVLDQHQAATHAEQISKRGNDCQSEVVLTVERVYKGSFVSLDAPDGDNFSQFTFDMRSMDTNESFWRGTASTPYRRGEYFSARTIVSRLLRDGVITEKQNIQPETSLTSIP
jgi:hypothetical protein